MKKQYITPWFDSKVAIEKRFNGVSWYDCKEDKWRKCPAPCVTLYDDYNTVYDKPTFEEVNNGEK